MEINITFETLFDLLRKEKTNESLQKLSENFYDEVTYYISQKQLILDDMQNKNYNEFNDEELAANLGQLKSIRKIIKELIQRRQRKIIEMAFNKSNADAKLIDTS